MKRWILVKVRIDQGKGLMELEEGRGKEGEVVMGFLGWEEEFCSLLQREMEEFILWVFMFCMIIGIYYIIKNKGIWKRMNW